MYTCSTRNSIGEASREIREAYKYTHANRFVRVDGTATKARNLHETIQQYYCITAMCNVPNQLHQQREPSAFLSPQQRTEKRELAQSAGSVSKKVHHTVIPFDTYYYSVDGTVESTFCHDTHMRAACTFGKI